MRAAPCLFVMALVLSACCNTSPVGRETIPLATPIVLGQPLPVEVEFVNRRDGDVVVGGPSGVTLGPGGAIAWIGHLQRVTTLSGLPRHPELGLLWADPQRTPALLEGTLPFQWQPLGPGQWETAILVGEDDPWQVLLTFEEAPVAEGQQLHGRVVIEEEEDLIEVLLAPR